MPPTRRSSRRTPRHNRSGRTGFALAEALVALALLTVGLLALAGSTAARLRADTSARAVATASALIADRIERIAHARCAADAGVRTERGVEERWRLTASGDGYTLVDTVRYAGSVAGAVAVGIETTARCTR